MPKLSAPLLSALLSVATLAGCAVMVAPTTTSGNRPPVIQSSTHSPSGVIGKDDVLTFTIVAMDPEGQPLSYTWSSTRGTLSATTGQAISWRPIKSDGTVDAGLATVTVMVSDGAQTATSTFNIQVDAQGQATVQGNTASPAPTASPSASVSPTPSATPSASASATPTPAPSAQPSASGAATPAESVD